LIIYQHLFLDQNRIYLMISIRLIMIYSHRLIIDLKSIYASADLYIYIKKKQLHFLPTVRMTVVMGRKLLTEFYLINQIFQLN